MKEYSPKRRTALVMSGSGTSGAYHAGVLRIQINANHRKDSIEGLIQALADLKKKFPLPGPEEVTRQAA